MLRGKVPLLIAAVLALIAGVVAWSAIAAQQARLTEPWVLVEVIVASTDLSEGAALTNDMVARRSIPRQFVTSSVVKPDSLSYIINQQLLVPLQAGDPVLWSQFATNRANERLSTKVVPRTRAVTVDGRSAVGGWVKPNDHVDVIGTFKSPRSGELVATTIMQNVVVLATGKVTGTTNVNLLPEEARAYSNVSLMVLPEEAEVLVLAQELGNLTFSLRSDNDLDLMNDRAHSTLDTLLSGERMSSMAKQRVALIEEIRGGKRVQ